MKWKLSIIIFFLLQYGISFSQAIADEQKAREYITTGQGVFNGLEMTSDQLRISSEHISSISGVHHIYYQQMHNGIDIVQSVGSVHLDEAKNVAYATNGFVNMDNIRFSSGRIFSSAESVTLAAGHFNLPQVRASSVISTPDGISETQTFNNPDYSSRDIPVRLVYIIEGSELVLNWEVFLVKPDDGFMWLTYVNTATGNIDKTRSLTISCSPGICKSNHDHGSMNKKNSTKDRKSYQPVTANSYNVFAIPLEAPNEGSRSIVTEPWKDAPVDASPFGWHDTDGIAGAEFTTTQGNNVLAEDDPDGNNGTPGVRPNGGAMLMFDFALDTSMQPSTYVNAAVTNLFYMNNIMHDVTYQFGFTEAAGNFQFNNYGNGGIGGDEVFADAQDGSGLNNATFGTPPDGSNPSMTMFQWVEDNMELTVNAPGNVAGMYEAGGAAFNPVTANVTSNVVESIPNEACTGLTNPGAVSGNIALIDRGSCAFVTKVINAQNAGAVGVIICNNVAGDGVFTMGGSSAGITIPSAMLSLEDCQTIRVEIANGLNVTLDAFRTVPNTDSDLDNGIIAHEYGHGISNRLTGGAGNTFCLNGDEQMGEGWSDFYSLLLQMKPGDMEGDRNGIGTYVTFDTPDGDGIRPFPYSTDMSINPFTYNDIGSGVSIPHGVGSVWCTVLWDMTWQLINEHGFSASPYDTTSGNGIAMKLVMEGMKLQPCDVGFVSGRDAILAADTLLYNGDNSCAIWRAFARRGLGVGADEGSVFSVTDGTESFIRPAGCFDEMVGPCTEEVLAYLDEEIMDGTDERVNTSITITNSDVLTGSDVQLRAGDDITVDSMEVEDNGILFMKIIPCDESVLPRAQKLKRIKESKWPFTEIFD